MKLRLFFSSKTPLLLTAFTSLSFFCTTMVFAAPPPEDPLASATASDDGLGLGGEELGDGESKSTEQTAPAPLPPEAAVSLINDLCKTLDQAQSASTVNQRLAILAPTIDKVFDLDGILVRSVGHGFDTLSPDDKKLLQESFYRYTLAHYASIFKPGTSAVFSVDPDPKKLSPTKLVIHTKIGGENDNGDGTAIDYVMEPDGTQWKVKDVLLEGHISQVAAQRSDFRLPFRDNGAKGLSELLEGKTQTALQGS
ncbi:hypothetical protein FAI40_03130 [Acetobacteraceae bacterium]|nr:hypothetical protein FAI40_03130 [Acetobacteraceae bacterium]